MPNKNYISGRNFEYRVRDYLVSKGYLVIRSAGSKGVADLVAIRKVDKRGLYVCHRPILIQCKHGHSGFIGYNKVIKDILNKHDVRFIHAFNCKKEIIFDEYRAEFGKHLLIQPVEL